MVRFQRTKQYRIYLFCVQIKKIKIKYKQRFPALEVVENADVIHGSDVLCERERQRMEKVKTGKMNRLKFKYFFLIRNIQYVTVEKKCNTPTLARKMGKKFDKTVFSLRFCEINT